MRFNQLSRRIVNRVIRGLPSRYQLKALTCFRLLSGDVDPELARLAEYLPANRRCTAIDVGANNGVVSCVLAKFFDSVHAIEPNPGLTARWAAYAPPNVTVHTMALSDRCGVATLQIPVSRGIELEGWASLGTPGAENIDDLRQVEVKCCTLDSLEISHHRVDFIKLDVEGHEIPALEGAKDCIARWQPWLIVEAWDRAAIVGKLAELGYTVLPLDELLDTRIQSPNIAFRPTCVVPMVTH